MTRNLLLVVGIAALGLAGLAGTVEDRKDTFQTDAPAYRRNIILGRPTDRSIVLSILMAGGAKVKVAYGRAGKELTARTDPVELNGGEARQVLLDGLAPDSAYEYRLIDGESGRAILPEEGPGRFRTCRAAGSAFPFTITADSHLDSNCAPELYQRCLANVLADRPDFHVDLGDTFMSGKHETRESAGKQYAAQRYYFGLIGQAMPLFLVIGNHDGEEIKRPADTDGDGLAVWSCLQRKRLFPNPEPDRFYTGNADKHPQAGLLQDYYAWTWGDALIAVVDPYWTGLGTRGGKEPWNMTLGRTQYDWLARTLRGSKAKYKFVFIHQLVGGQDAAGRGGAEAAGLYEWGGREIGGQNTFAQHRPGWDKPIHDLLVEAKVNVLFHGHDHFFAHQKKDGIVYQLVPQPAPRSFLKHQADEYGYKQGTFLPSAGHLRVRVDKPGITVEYIRAATPEMQRANIRNGEVAFRYAAP